MGSQVRTAIYCRVSTEEQAREGFSIAAQRKTLTSFSMDKGWEITKEYIDEGASGKNMRRPAFQELLRDADRRKFDVVLVWKINRFSRRNADLLNTAGYLSEHGINLVSYCEQFDASTPSGKLMLSMLGSIGEFERDTIVENIRAGMEERARQGLFNGGRVLGYDIVNGELKINEREAHTVLRIFELFLSGLNLGSICDILDCESRKTKNNLPFSITSIKRILSNPIYAGFISYNNSIKHSCTSRITDASMVNPGKHKPIIKQEQYESVKNIMNSKVQRYLRVNSYILSGILVCPGCGSRMSGHTIGKYRYYVCSNYKRRGNAVCSSHCISAPDAEKSVMEQIFSLVKCPSVTALVYKKAKEMKDVQSTRKFCEYTCIEKEISSLKSTKLKYFKYFENDTESMSTLLGRIHELDAAISTLEDRLLIIINEPQMEDISYDKVQKILSGFKEIYSNLDAVTKKRLLASVIKKACFTKDKGLADITLLF